MMYQEFMEIAGYKVSVEDYENIIEPMYMATKLSKQEFVKVIDRKRFEVVEKTERQYINEIKKIAKVMYEKCGHVETIEEETEIYNILREMSRKFSAVYEPMKTNFLGSYYISSICKYKENLNKITEFEVI